MNKEKKNLCLSFSGSHAGKDKNDYDDFTSAFHFCNLRLLLSFSVQNQTVTCRFVVVNHWTCQHVISNAIFYTFQIRFSSLTWVLMARVKGDSVRMRLMPGNRSAYINRNTSPVVVCTHQPMPLSFAVIQPSACKINPKTRISEHLGMWSSYGGEYLSCWFLHSSNAFLVCSSSVFSL